MSDIALLPAHALAEAIGHREVSSRELLEHYLARVERLNPALNAVVTLDPDGARMAADAADAALARGENVGPLHGVPMTIKDTYQTAGVRTTCGLAAWDHVPEHDAEAVRRLRDAGAVIFGKTNTPTLAADWQTYNPIFGTSNNPWDTTRTTGGSSGGAAAAVATGMTALELGSDIAGSIRVPSNWCGVCGHKPTWGVVPQRGFLPPAPGTLASTDLNVIGPIARDVDDLELALGVLAGAAGLAAVGWRLELPAPRGATLRELRLALWLDDPAYPVDPEIGEVLGLGCRCAAGRRRLGWSMRGRAWRCRTWCARISSCSIRFCSSRWQRIDSTTWWRWRNHCPPRMTARWPARRASPPSATAIGSSPTRSASGLRALMAEFFCDVDALLMPVAVVPAIPHDQSEPFADRVISSNGGTRPYTDMMGWMALATLTHLPATVVPVGRTTSGLPVGIQIVGPYLEDRTTLAVARLIEELLGGFVPPPAA